MKCIRLQVCLCVDVWRQGLRRDLSLQCTLRTSSFTCSSTSRSFAPRGLRSGSLKNARWDLFQFNNDSSARQRALISDRTTLKLLLIVSSACSCFCLQDLSKVAFRFKDKERPRGYTSKVAGLLHVGTFHLSETFCSCHQASPWSLVQKIRAKKAWNLFKSNVPPTSSSFMLFPFNKFLFCVAVLPSGGSSRSRVSSGGLQAGSDRDGARQAPTGKRQVSWRKVCLDVRHSLSSSHGSCVLQQLRPPMNDQKLCHFKQEIIIIIINVSGFLLINYFCTFLMKTDLD